MAKYELDVSWIEEEPETGTALITVSADSSADAIERAMAGQIDSWDEVDTNLSEPKGIKVTAVMDVRPLGFSGYSETGALRDNLPPKLQEVLSRLPDPLGLFKAADKAVGGSPSPSDVIEKLPDPERFAESLPGPDEFLSSPAKLMDPLGLMGPEDTGFVPPPPPKPFKPLQLRRVRGRGRFGPARPYRGVGGGPPVRRRIGRMVPGRGMVRRWY